MNDIEIKLLNAKLYLNYYKNNNILDRYATIIEGLVTDNDCLSVLKNPNEKLYITLLSKNVNKEEKYKDLEQIEKEHKEENGRLREENKKLQEFYEKYYDSINSELNGLLTHKFIGYIPISKIKEKYLNMEREYSKKVYDKKYNRKEVKKEEFYKRQVYEELLEESEKKYGRIQESTNNTNKSFKTTGNRKY